MKWFLDLNVLLDVIQQRPPFFETSAQVLSRVVRGEVTGHIAGHELTTAHYIVKRYTDHRAADDLVDWLLVHFEIVAESEATFRRARALEWNDFEDAVIASAAEETGCDFVVTRNIKDFANSPVPAITPVDLLGLD